MFGGTFNPVHLGHVGAARDVMHRFALDCIYFIPSAHPPHKPDAALAAAPDRYEMVSLGLADSAAMCPSDVEIRRNGPSYSVDTVTFYKRRLGRSVRLFFLLGVDAFLEIDTWKSYETILEEAAFVVMSRPPHARTENDLYALTAPYIKATLSQAYVYEAAGRVWTHASRPPIFLAEVVPVEIASSQLRDKIRRGESAEQWLSPAVVQYIKQKGLYRWTRLQTPCLISLLRPLWGGKRKTLWCWTCAG